MPPPSADDDPSGSPSAPTILAVGEILWDALPEGLFLGGAPFNVACHLRALGEETAFASRVGDDALGEEILRRVPAHGLNPDLVQVDDSLPTGLVRVALDRTDEPKYEIVEPAAWDAINLSDPLREQAARSDALVFGSLAQRAPPSRRTIRALLEADLVRVFDVNLRPPFVDREVIEHSLQAAHIVKLNGDELQHLRAWYELPTNTEAAMAALAERFESPAICVTWGSEGASLWRDGKSWHHSGYPVEAADPVGAGDAFLAALLSGLLDNRDEKTVLDRANELGAYVASHSGAIPPYEIDEQGEIGTPTRNDPDPHD